jgi:hypothetical protein
LYIFSSHFLDVPILWLLKLLRMFSLNW